MIKIFDSDLFARQKLVCSLLSSAIERKALAPAYLFVGRATTDKWLLTKALASFFNCTNEKKLELGSCLSRIWYPHSVDHRACSNCRWINENTHPQALISLSGQDSKSGKIAIEKVRLLLEELLHTSIYFRTIVVPNASQESLHRPAANALLKTVEEHNSACVFIFFANSWQDVLPTIVSRCQILPVIHAESEYLWLAEEQKQELTDLITETRQHITAAPHGDFEDLVSSTKTLESTIAWSKLLVEIADNKMEPSLLIDMLVADEWTRLKNTAQTNPGLSLYLSNLSKLAQTTKEQISQFVQIKVAFEWFALSVRQLAHE